MWPFKKRRTPQVDIGRGFQLYPDEAPRFPVEPTAPGPFRILHRKGRLWRNNSSSATEYAYDSLALVPMFPINHIFAVQTPMKAAQPGMQVYVNPGVLTYELPQPNGQIFTQPLYDPNATPFPDNG